ncbi:MAG: hypothetical protein FJ317_07505 [SAR202 cluster bacterium]|nr:hypothetical protein [SAR202 cluster bacterium]
MADDILLEKKDGVATVTLNRPTQRNAISYHGWLDLQRIFIDLEHDAGVKVAVLTGAGDAAFSSGADIKDFDLYRNSAAKARIYADAFEGAMNALEALSKPSICLIKGFCVGGGCELTLAADIRIAADNSKFGIPVAKLGILIGYGEMRRLVNLIGPGNAAYILYTGRMYDAADALRVGLINQAVPLAEIDAHVYKLANEMTKLAPLTQSRHKRIMQTVLANPGLKGLTPEEQALPLSNFDSEDFHEGRRAFIERRTPEFKGR